MTPVTPQNRPCRRALPQQRRTWLSSRTHRVLDCTEPRRYPCLDPAQTPVCCGHCANSRSYDHNHEFVALSSNQDSLFTELNSLFIFYPGFDMKGTARHGIACQQVLRTVVLLSSRLLQRGTDYITQAMQWASRIATSTVAAAENEPDKSRRSRTLDARSRGHLPASQAQPFMRCDDPSCCSVVEMCR